MCLYKNHENLRTAINKNVNYIYNTSDLLQDKYLILYTISKKQKNVSQIYKETTKCFYKITKTYFKNNDYVNSLLCTSCGCFRIVLHILKTNSKKPSTDLITLVSTKQFPLKHCKYR